MFCCLPSIQNWSVMTRHACPSSTENWSRELKHFRECVPPACPVMGNSAQCGRPPEYPLKDTHREQANNCCRGQTQCGNDLWRQWVFNSCVEGRLMRRVVMRICNS